MIWFRRFIAVLLAIIFIPLFIVMLLVAQVNATLGNPAFYVDQLQEADIYSFIYDEILPAVPEQIGTELDITQVEAEVISVTRQIFPPEWTQTQVEEVITQVLPFLVGDTEEFTVTLQLKERVRAAGPILKDSLHKEDTYDQVITYTVAQALSAVDNFPYTLTVSNEEMESAIRSVISREWLLSQVDQVIDQVFPYLAGDAEHFTVSIDLQTPLNAAATVTIDLLDKPETYDYLFDEMIAPMIEENVDELVSLPFELNLTNQEILSVVKQTFPQSWFKDRVEDIVNQVVSYLEGSSDTITMVVPLVEQKAAALDALEDLVENKVDALLMALPECTPQQLYELMQNLPLTELPDCRPAGMSLAELKQTLGIDFGEAIEDTIGDAIPNQFQFTEADLRQMLGGENGNPLDIARQYVTGSRTFTDTDLPHSLRTDVRDGISHGFTFTETELRDLLTGNDAGGNGLGGFDEVRYWLSLVRQWLFVGWVILALLLGLIGFLGGRKVSRKIAWAAAVLGISAAIVYIATGPVYSGIVQPEMDTVLSQQSAQVEEWASVFVDKGISMIKNAADTLVSGIQNQALILLVIAGTALVATIVWPILSGRQKSPEAGSAQS